MNQAFDNNVNARMVSSTSGISFSGRALFRALFAAGAVYLVVFAVAFLLAAGEGAAAPALILLHLGAAASFLVYWRLGRWGKAKYDSFGAALLLVAAIFRAQAACDTLAYGLRLEVIPSTVPLTDPVIWWFFKGELISQIGILMVVSAWRVVVGRKVEQFSFLNNPKAAPIRLAVAVYVAGLLVNVASLAAPTIFGVFQQFASLTFSFSVASIYFIAARQARTSRKISVAVLLGLPMVAMALGSGMKEEMFFPLVPAALLYWFGYRAVAPRLLAVALSLFLLALSQLYVGYVRDTTWRTNSVEVPLQKTLSNFGAEMGSLDMLDGLGRISSRINMTTTHVITVSLADHYGHEPFEVFGLIPASFVPRMFWPGKPVLQPGAMHTARIHGWDTDLSNIGSATAAGFSTELYLGGGFIAVLLGAGLYGLLMAWAQKWLLKTVPGFGCQAFSFIAMYWTLRFDEKAVVYAYTSIVFTIIFIWLMKRGAGMFGLRMQSYGTGRRT